MNRYTCFNCGEWLSDDEEQLCRDCLRAERDEENGRHEEPATAGDKSVQAKLFPPDATAMFEPEVKTRKRLGKRKLS